MLNKESRDKIKTRIKQSRGLLVLLLAYITLVVIRAPLTQLLQQEETQQQLGRSLYEGWLGLLDYLEAHVLFCLIPAFFIAGAVNTLLSSSQILKYMSAKANKVRAYLVASLGGFFIQVCSCTILPLFAGIWKRGAGIGVATTFLYAGPAINLLAFVLTGQRIGWEMAIVRLILSILFAISAGLIMEKAFREKTSEEDMHLAEEMPATEPGKKTTLFWINLLLILIVGTFPMAPDVKNYTMAFLIGIQILMSYAWLSREKRKAWWQETLKFLSEIIPLLLLGVFLAAVVTNLIPQEAFQNLTGRNTILANFLAVVFGAIAYFPALVEIPIAENFMNLGMNKGPLLAYLLSDPVLSLQGLLIINRLIGAKKTLVYTTSIVILTTLAGYIYGML